MSLKDDKKSVLTTIGAFTSLKQEGKVPNQNDSFLSVNNKNEIVPYLLDVLKTVAGTEALKQLTGRMFTKFISDIEPKLKVTLKKQFVQYNSDDNLPDSFKNGIDIPVKSIDSKSKLKTDPNTSQGSLLYDNSKANFDSKAYQAITNEGSDTTFNNLVINYDSNTDSFKFKPDNGNTSINTWVTSYIDDTEILNKKELTTLVMDKIYGNITSTQNKSIENIKEELEVDQLIDQLINNDDSFEISNDLLEELENKAKELANGIVNYDLGCGIMESKLSFNDFNSTVLDIANSNDDFNTANAIENSINDSSTNNDLNDENQQTIKDNFFQKIIKIFINKIVQATTTSPQIRMLLGVTSAIQNNGTVVLETAKKDLEKFKVLIKCIINDLIKLVVEFIYKLVISYLVELTKPVIKKIIKEKTNQFKRIIKSLTTSKTG
jgi:hypothetical protein